ncbi:MAG TPA: LPS export ABC transporter periplasmic protein LptC [Cyanobacteria bacterium UBA9971]|nr:LPS export ABC transporter periplasmic protein LptC [Cyanobacteria bacterium UBA9971]
MSKKTLTSIIILCVLTVLSVWVFFSDSGEKVKPNPETPSATKNVDNEQVKIIDIIITETTEGEKFWEVVASSANYDKGVDIATLQNVRGNFYKNNVVVLSVEAPLAIYNSAKKEVILKNGAKAANNKNVLITAKEICWAGKTDMITAKGNVKITQDDKMLTTSDKSIFNSDFTNLKLSGNSNSYVYR